MFGNGGDDWKEGLQRSACTFSPACRSRRMRGLEVKVVGCPQKGREREEGKKGVSNPAPARQELKDFSLKENHQTKSR